MRILITSLNYAPEEISTGKYIGEMAAWLSSRGHDVRVVTTVPHYPEWKVREGFDPTRYTRKKVKGVDTWRCPAWVPESPNGPKRLLYLASFAASSFPVMLLQARWRPDVIVVIAPTLFCMPAAWLTGKVSGAATVLRVLDFEVDAAMGLGMLRKENIRKVLYGVEKLLLQSATTVTTLTDMMRRKIVEKGIPDDRTWLSPDWSDIQFVRPGPRDNAVRKEFGAGPSDTLVMHAGNMGEKQGLELALEAADRLRDRSDIKFVLVGNGAMRKRLEKRAAELALDNVRFFPVQPLEKLPLMLAAADIHLLIQRREAADLVMPSRLTNILASGRASIATAEPGTTLHDVVSVNDCGVNTTPEDADALARGILNLAGDPELRETLGRNARAYAEANLDKETLLSRFEDNLRRISDGQAL